MAEVSELKIEDLSDNQFCTVMFLKMAEYPPQYFRVISVYMLII